MNNPIKIEGRIPSGSFVKLTFAGTRRIVASRMNQDEQTPGKRRLLEEAVERHGQMLEHVQEVLQQPGPNEEQVRRVIEESVRQTDEVKRELERQDTGMLPKASDNSIP
jgi:hypothetical protein